MPPRKDLLDKIQGTTFQSHILAIHALSGCDTTSRIYGKGKEFFFSINRDNVEYINAVELFYKIDTPKELRRDHESWRSHSSHNII